MTTTKFSPGDRVSAYTNTGRLCGKVFHNRIDGMVDVLLDGEIGTRFFHPKQLRRLKKKPRVVWESVYPIGTNDTGDGLFRVSDQRILEKFNLSKFLGKRVRIEITEAKPQDKGER